MGIHGVDIPMLKHRSDTGNPLKRILRSRHRFQPMVLCQPLESLLSQDCFDRDCFNKDCRVKTGQPLD